MSTYVVLMPSASHLYMYQYQLNLMPVEMCLYIYALLWLNSCDTITG